MIQSQLQPQQVQITSAELTLTGQTIMVILNALAELPYKDSAQAIMEIQRQLAPIAAAATQKAEVLPGENAMANGASN